MSEGELFLNNEGEFEFIWEVLGVFMCIIILEL